VTVALPGLCGMMGRSGPGVSPLANDCRPSGAKTGKAPALGDPADWKLIVVTPSKLVEAPVKFKLENIPLP